MSAKELSEQLSAVARSMSSEEDVALTMDRALVMAGEMIEGCDEAAVAFIDKKHGLDTVAVTSDAAARGDALQAELGEGPCLDAAWREESVVAGDLSTDDRWPAWGPRVAEELGMQSMLCFQLFVTEDSLGAMDLYSRHRDAFTEDDRVDGRALAAQVAVALAATRRVGHLHTAITNRTVIGQAQGILMERFDIDPDRAFAVLRRVSSHSNQKLHQVARELVRSRQLPNRPSQEFSGT